MTHKEVVQTQLDFLNSILSSVVIGGLIGIILLIIQVVQSPSGLWVYLVLMVAIGGLAIVGICCVSYRKKFLLELENMD
jgi:hypothetical protein